MFDLKETLEILDLPYKKSKAYEAFCDSLNKPRKHKSVFWDTDINYVVQYENAEINDEQPAQLVKKPKKVTKDQQ